MAEEIKKYKKKLDSQRSLFYNKRDSMSWIYFLSLFTQEALLLEASLFFMLLACSCALFLLKKRKYGVSLSSIPAGPFSYYLNHLLTQTQEIKNQLFGYQEGESLQDNASLGALVHLSKGSSSSKEEILIEKIKKYETELKALSEEKKEWEQKIKLIETQSQSTDSHILSGAETQTVVTLKEKVVELETKLAEYSIIEDDLANLKRLQLENNQLKNLLEEKEEKMLALATESQVKNKLNDSSMNSMPDTASVKQNMTEMTNDIPEVKKEENNLVADFEKMIES